MSIYSTPDPFSAVFYQPQFTPTRGKTIKPPKSTWRSTVLKTSAWIVAGGAAVVGIGYALNRFYGFTLPGWGQQVSTYVDKADYLVKQATKYQGELVKIRDSQHAWSGNGPNYDSLSACVTEGSAVLDKINRYYKIISKAPTVDIAIPYLKQINDAAVILQTQFSEATKLL